MGLPGIHQPTEHADRRSSFVRVSAEAANVLAPASAALRADAATGLSRQSFRPRSRSHDPTAVMLDEILADVSLRLASRA